MTVVANTTVLVLLSVATVLGSGSGSSGGGDSVVNLLDVHLNDLASAGNERGGDNVGAIASSICGGCSFGDGGVSRSGGAGRHVGGSGVGEEDATAVLVGDGSSCSRV